jgi:alcohol dehydrogenase class IV
VIYRIVSQHQGDEGGFYCFSKDSNVRKILCRLDKKKEEEMSLKNEKAGAIYWIPGVRMPRLVIGNGCIEGIGKEVSNLKGKKAIIISDRNIVKLGLVEKAKKAIEKENLGVDLFEDVEYEPDIATVEKAIKIVREKSYDIVIGFGGGSALDAAKVIACLAKNEGEVRDYLGVNKIPKRGLPSILVPTTAGTGAEVSPVSVLTDEKAGNKNVISDSKLFADVALVDPLLTVLLPPRLTAYTGIDALCHAMGGYITRKATPVSDALAMEAIYLIGRNLRRAVSKGQTDMEARYNMALGATMGMIARTNSGGGAVHGLSYPLGTKYHLPHGQSISLLLPHVMAFNVGSAVPKFIRIAEAMGEKTEGLSGGKAADKAIEAIKALLKDIGISEGLRDIGVKKEDFPEFADIVYEVSYRHIEANPRHLTKGDVIQIYENAW